jgi:hypothetical protein
MRRPALVLRLLLLGYLSWAGIRQLTDAEYAGLFEGVNFGVHELGHLVFAFLGEWMSVAGGSLGQLLLPLAAALLFRRQGDRFAVAVCVGWLAISLADLAPYIADARAEELDLVSFSEDGAVHDWNYLLGRAGLLADDRRIAAFVRALAWAVLAAGLTAGGVALREMARRPADASRAQG